MPRKQTSLSALLFISSMIIAAPPGEAVAQDAAPLITYGRDSRTGEGDDDFAQVVFIEVPDGADSIYVRLFDPDCGGTLDATYGGGWNSETAFKLYGGVGAYSTTAVRQAVITGESRSSGTLLATALTASDPFTDNLWMTLAPLVPAQGELIEGKRYFRLVAEGISGDDGNYWNVTVSRFPQRNVLPTSARLFTFAPTFRLTELTRFAELRFRVPEGTGSVTVSNFDAAEASLSVETAFRGGLRFPASKQDEWAKGTVELEPVELPHPMAIRFEGGKETPNDATFYLSTASGEPIPIELPIYLRKPNGRPLPAFRYEQLADCHSIVFDASASSDPEGDALTYHWSFADGGRAEGSRVVHSFDAPGVYQNFLTLTDNSGQVGNGTRVPVSIVINDPPDAAAGSDVVAAPGEELTFDGSASVDRDGKLVLFQWDFGDGERATGVRAKHGYKVSGFYTVTLRVGDDSDSPCRFDEDQLTVWVNAPPVVDIGPDHITAIDQTVFLSAANHRDSDGEIASYRWDMGDGTKLEGSVVSHSYARSGYYLVRALLTDDAGVANSSCRDSLRIFVNEPPVADAGKDWRVATDEAILFDASGSEDADGKLIDYIWDFGDGASTHGSKVKHPYASPGTYWVVLTIQDDSRSITDRDIDSAYVIINYPPVSIPGPDQWVTESEVHFDGSGSFDDDGWITDYHWDFGDGSSAKGPRPIHTYGNPGTYTVRLTVTDDSKTSTQKTWNELSVLVNRAPVADAGADQTGAPGQTLVFDASGSVDKDGSVKEYLWDFGDGSTGSGERASHAYRSPGLYNVLLTVKDNTGHTLGRGFDQSLIRINAEPEADAGPDQLVAPGQKVVFDGTGSVDRDGKVASYEWTFSDGAPPVKSVKTTRVFDRSGVVTATLTVVDNDRVGNSTARDQMVVRINTPPVAAAGPDVFTCSQTIDFDGSASADPDGDPLKMTWDFGDGSPPKVGAKVSHTYLKGGTFPIILKVDDGSGMPNATAITSKTVRINMPPLANAGPDKRVCAGDVVIFDGGASTDPEGGLLRYFWDFGDSTFAEGVNPTTLYKKGGVYRVTLRVEDDSSLPTCNSSTDQIVVWVSQSPISDAGPDQTVCAGVPVQFDGSKSWDIDGLVNNYLWDFGDGQTGGGPTPTHIFTAPGAYRVTLTITGDKTGDCDNTNSDDMIVTVYEAPLATFKAPSRAALPLPVSFDASESRPGGGKIVQYAWDFGDSTTGEGAVVQHRYARAGRYYAQLTVTNDSETDCNQTTVRSLIVVNDAPVPNGGPDRLAGVDEELLFDASKSSDADGVITRCDWDFADGTTATGVQVRKAFRKSGVYPVRLFTTDDAGLENSRSVDTIFVDVNAPPQPVVEVNVNACAGREARISAARSSDADGAIKSYHWDFGDGSTGEGVETTHTWFLPGKYILLLTLDDGRGALNSRVQLPTTIIANLPPVAEAGLDRIVSPNEPSQFDAAGSYDPDGKITGYHWDFGDGATATGAKVSHSYAAPGTFRATLTVTDNSGSDCPTGSETVIVRANAAPIPDAGGDREGFAGGAHDAILFDASASRDPDGDPLQFAWEFGDGSTGKGAKAAHVFAKPGTYRVKLKLDDGTGTKAGLATQEITVIIRAHGR